MKVCTDNTEVKKDQEFVAGHLYKCNIDNDVRMCVLVGFDAILYMVKLKDGTHCNTVSGRPRIETKYTDVTEDYCLKRI